MKRAFTLLLLAVMLYIPSLSYAVSSVNIPLGSRYYNYLDKIAAAGLITSDFKGIYPLSKSEAARLVLEAEKSSLAVSSSHQVQEMLVELKSYLGRELSLYDTPAAAPQFSYKPLTDARARLVYLDGRPRNFERGVHDPGGDGVFGIGGGLRPDNPYPTVAMQRGSEGTPLFENNEGVRYNPGGSVDLSASAEASITELASLLIEPRFIATDGLVQVRLNRGYVKIGGKSLEVELGRDSDWLGFGKRGAITLSNNAYNFDQLKLSSPEPVDVAFIGKMKYAFILSRMDRVGTDHGDRQPWFYAIKLSAKPVPEFEFGINLGRQQGGPGVSSTFRDYFQGLVGGTSNDNSNSLGGLEVRYRFASLRNSEAYFEFSGEDAAKFWPIVESYLGGIYIPRLTDDGRHDLRFEYFYGNRILYTHSQFSQGYLYKGLPIGHSQGGATTDYFLQYGHWFSAREHGLVDLMYTTRGDTGRLPGQSHERKYALRGSLSHSLSDTLDLKLLYGVEHTDNLNLVAGDSGTNHLLTTELTYRY